MVDGSELPWRLLSRKYNSQLAYTPMFHAANFALSAKYREKQFTTCPEDRPLLVQFCANDPDTLLKAARIAEPHCDGIDINLGCPQNIARRGAACRVGGTGCAVSGQRGSAVGGVGAGGSASRPLRRVFAGRVGPYRLHG